jgi:hypothetical protein
MDLHEVPEGECGAHKDERLSRSQVEKKLLKTKFGILQEKAGVVTIIEVAKHVAERRLGRFKIGRSEEKGREFWKWPAIGNGFFVKMG